LQDAQDDECFEVRGQTAEGRREAEAREPKHEHTAPAVCVGERAGQYQQSAQRQQVARVDVGLTLQHSDE
jgi:hypothetical protein